VHREYLTEHVSPRFPWNGWPCKPTGGRVLASTGRDGGSVDTTNWALYRSRWPWMILNSVIALTLCFSPNSIALLADYVTVVEDRPIMSVKYCLPIPVFYLAKTITHPAARFLYDSWASCWVGQNVYFSAYGSLCRRYRFSAFSYAKPSDFRHNFRPRNDEDVYKLF